MSETEKSNNHQISEDEVKQMFEAGAHFGYSRSRRHPSTRPFLFGNKNRVDIIDLEKTHQMTKQAMEFVKNLAKDNKQILFVGCKPEIRDIVKQGAQKADTPYMVERWIGGTLTNFSEIKKRINELKDLTEKQDKGQLDKYTKKEQLLLQRKADRLDNFFGGLLEMEKLPAALFVVDPLKEKNAVREALHTGTPIIALASSDCNISKIDHPILANDSSVKSVKYFVNKLAETYKQNKDTQEEEK